MDGRTRPSWWLIAKHDGGRSMEVLTVELDSGEGALPVFSFEEEADLFLAGLGASGEGWRARPTTVGELVSVLMGPCASVGRILLDPLPAIAGCWAADLIGTGREEFLGLLLGRGKPRTRY
jgi:hypothetical protein